MSTYNRGELLADAVRSVLTQHGPAVPPFELIVVDNNSTDGTRDVVEGFARADARVRYVFEAKQGLSHARNAGIREARAALVAFTDDDVRVDPYWIASLIHAFAEYSGADAVGGRVLPLWPSPPPAWLTRDHWAPLALMDFGDESFAVTPERQVCLLGANVAFRRSVFDLIGGFATEFQRVKDGIGSIEDHEFLLRLLGSGRTGVYDPRIVVHAEIQPNRLERAYHRRWHTGHGHFHAMLRSEYVERTRRGTFLGVPAHLYRQALRDTVAWIAAVASGTSAAAFKHELGLRFFHGFFRTRLRQFVHKSWRARRAGPTQRCSCPSAGTAGQQEAAVRQTGATLVTPLARAVRDLDKAWQRLRRPDARHVVFDARTAMEYAMMRPVHRRLMNDPRVATWLMSSERPHRVDEIFRDAPRDSALISPRLAMLKRFDAYVAADFLWASLPRGTCRVQMFHGVAGKWSQLYDRPSSSMRHWDRLFFINRRRLRNYIASGAVASDSPSIRLVGMPKVDCLVDGSLNRDDVLRAHAIDPARTTVLYAPTWTPYSSLNSMGEEVVSTLIDAGYTVLVKLHENSLDRTFANSGGIDWVARLAPILASDRGHLIRSSDAAPWLVAADVLITDHSSVGFEYLLLDRPLVRIAMPQLIEGANIAREYVDLIASASVTAEHPTQVADAVEHGLANPAHLSAERQALAADLFHDPGEATNRAVAELYALMELEDPARHTASVMGTVMLPAPGALSRQIR
jgi:glycosyltransferase involved in cell wall biosynthesis